MKFWTVQICSAVLNCDMTNIPLDSRTDLSCPKFHWTAKIGAGHHMSRAHPALRNFSMRRVLSRASYFFPFNFPFSLCCNLLWNDVIGKPNSKTE
ncbi:hypothetical protein RHMOL_Rhmol05G0113900 [Rhododendron molle]|uniref:Uncharacterized protein n=1 Tax=Rhododendron molle TaxID=49168 RepID=A0ACC0NMN7_RHOML|nr:hypothetical protein RHMOL_Rhmol05G0113900 [Rhododendron molle]